MSKATQLLSAMAQMADGSHFCLTVKPVIFPIILVSLGPHYIEVTALNVRYDYTEPRIN